MPTRLHQRWEWLTTFGPPIAAVVSLVVLSRAFEVVYPPISPQPSGGSLPHFLAWFISLPHYLGLFFTLPDLLVLFIILATAAEFCQISLTHGGATTFGPCVTIPAIVIIGPVPAAVVGMFAMALGNGLFRRRPIRTSIFNVGQRTVSLLLAGAAWTYLLPNYQGFGYPSLNLLGDNLIIVPLLGMLLVYALATAVQVNLWLSAVRRERFATVFWANAAWQFPISTTFGASGLAVALFLVGRPATPVVPFVIASFPLLVLTARRQALLEAEKIHRAVSDVLKTLNLDDLLAKLGEEVRRLANPDVVCILLQEPDGSSRIGLISGAEPAVLEPLWAGGDASPVGQAASSGQTVRIADYAKYVRRRPADQRSSLPAVMSSVIVAPLFAGETLLGTLIVTKAVPGYFTAYQERVVTTLAAQGALAIHNARLYLASQRNLARVAALQQVARAAVGGDTLHAVEQTMVDSAVGTLGASRGVVALYDAESDTLTGVAFHNVPPEEVAGWRVTGEPTLWQARQAEAALRQMGPVVVDDRRASSDDALEIAPDQPIALVAVPMSFQGRPIGTVTVGRTEAHHWTSEEIELLQALANEGAVTIESARLTHATARQLQQMRALEQISERINTEHNLDAIFTLIEESAHDVLGVHRCAIYLVDGDGGTTMQTYGNGVPEEYLKLLHARIRQGVSIANLALDEREPVIIADALQDPRIPPELQRFGFRTIATFPLSFRDASIGLLAFYHDTVHQYTAGDVMLGGAFANQAAIAVQNARLLQAAEARAHQLGLLHRTVTRVGSSLKPEELCETLVDELHTALGYPFAAIFLARGDRMQVMSHRGDARVPSDDDVLNGVIGRTVKTGQAQLVEDVSRDPDYIAGNPSITQEAVVPILLDGRVIGVLNVKTIEPTLTRADLDLLTTVASELAAAFRNAELFSQAQQRRDDLQALYEIAQELGTSLEVTKIADALVSATCQRFGYAYGTILLIDDALGDLTVRAAYGAPERIGQRIALGQGAEGRAAQTGRPELVPDASMTPPDGTQRQTAGAILAVPLTWEGRIAAVFSVGSITAGALGDRDRQLLTTLAAYGAVAIENARRYEQARHLAVTDGLTSLLNHRAFRQALEHEMERAKRYGLPLSLLMVEIDRFKRYNDAYGHLRGDEVLRKIAGILEREHRRQVDIVARYGGDEFIVCLPHTTKKAAAEVAERIRNAVESTPFILEADVASVTLSLGVAAYPEDGHNGNELVDAADRRMYTAKQGGGNAVVLATL